MALDSKFDVVSMRRKLAKFAAMTGETGAQSITRWGVSTARELAIRTEPFGKAAGGGKGNVLKKAMLKDANNVILTVKKQKAKARSVEVTSNSGKTYSVKSDRMLSNVNAVIEWINQNRVTKRKRTKELDIKDKKIALEKDVKSAVAKKYKATGGLAKSGFIDAGNSMANKQRGERKERIGVSFIKWAQKGQNVGTSRLAKRNFASIGDLVNNVSYVSDKYMLSETNKKMSIQIGARKAINFYRAVIKANRNKKKR